MRVVGTILRPKKPLIEYLKVHADNRLNKSVIAITTPQYAEQLKSLHAFLPNLQTIGIAMDTVPCGCQRDGFSWMILENHFEVLDQQPLKTTLDTNWKPTDVKLRLTAGESEMHIPAANTLFHNGVEGSIYAGSDESLSRLHVKLPFSLRCTGRVMPVKPLTSVLTVTSAVDNILKTLESRSAASFLEEAEELINASPKGLPIVYAEIFPRDGRGVSTFAKVTAGGGGLWSPRTRMLVLDPSVEPKSGDKIRFHLSRGSSLGSDTLSELKRSYAEWQRQEQIVVETAPIQEEVTDTGFIPAKRNEFLPVFGFGSELGVSLNGVPQTVIGEALGLQKVNHFW